MKLKLPFYLLPFLPLMLLSVILAWTGFHLQHQLESLSAAEAALKDSIRDIRLLFWGASLLSIIIVMAGIFQIKRRVYDPLNYMRYKVREMLAGNLGERLEVDACWEIQEVADNFNRMTGKIEDQIIELSSQSNTLQATNGMLEQKLREMDALFQISKTLSLITNADISISLVISMVKEVLKIDAVSVLLTDEEEGTDNVARLRVAASAGFSTSGEQGGIIAISGALPGSVFLSSLPVFVNGVKEDIDGHLCHEDGLGGWYAGFPLTFGGAGTEPGGERSLGVLNLVRYNAPFTDEMLEFVGTVSVYLAIYLRQARLYTTMKRLSIMDGLTGLHNHRHFKEVLKGEAKRSLRYFHPLSLIILDVDYFKKYNDTHGHPEGDVLLRQLAGILKSSIREIDLVARYGGEEFVVLLPSTNKAGALIVAERIRAAVENMVFSGGHTQPDGRVTVSVGAASLLEDAATDGEDLVKKADAALYKAKKGGRNRVVLASAE